LRSYSLLVKSAVAATFAWCLRLAIISYFKSFAGFVRLGNSSSLLIGSSTTFSLSSSDD
jgi:hypothetical protein